MMQKMRVIYNYLLLAVLMLPVTSFSQELKVDICSNTKIVSNLDLSLERGVRFAYTDSFRILTFSSSMSDDRKFFIYDISGKKLSELNIKKIKKFDNLGQELVHSMTILQNALIVVSSNYITQFEVDFENKKLLLINQIKNKDNFLYCSNLDSTIFLSVLYNFHPNDADNNHVWGIYNIQNRNIVKTQIMPDNDKIFSHFVNKWFDTHHNKILYAHSSEYKIYIFDNELNIKDSIVSPELNSNLPIIDSLTQISNSVRSKEKIELLKKIDDNFLTRIRKVYFLDSITIGVLIKKKNEDSLILDVWKNNNNVWSKFATKSFTIWYVEGQSYTSDNVSMLQMFYQNLNDFKLTKNSIFESWKIHFTPTVNTINFKKDQYYEDQNNQLLNEKNSFGCSTYCLDVNMEK